MSCNSALEPLMRSRLQTSWVLSTQVRDWGLVTAHSCTTGRTTCGCGVDPLLLSQMLVMALRSLRLFAATTQA